MSTLNIGKTCAECLQDGRCLSTCYTQGGGLGLATGFKPSDARTVVVATRALPDDAPAVAIVVCGGPQTVVNVIRSDAARLLARFINEKANEAER
ncbi:hypothetical protein Mx8p36 [Myxococcus phage Mx8]|uniref:p36 n=1 Tax=Myxococcus phage Mx8 TaxID=49964 RepID=Q94MT3_9CAUD|nr:hypothetical protein Mx8p36 [Myxococcus phage Mx8]AAK94371.1 p36 [Myxococcus phage Mx8]